MSICSKPFKVAAFEDGTLAVVRTDIENPHLIEIIATFYDGARAREYAHRENVGSTERPSIVYPAVSKKDILAPDRKAKDLSERQRAVLQALRTKMNVNKLVEAKAADLAKAADIPLGSLYSILQSLEKKQCILTKRSGSRKAPAVYEVL